MQEAKQLEAARQKLAREQKKRQEADAIAKMAAQRKAAQQAAEQLAQAQAKADLEQKRAERQVRVSFFAAARPAHTHSQITCGTSALTAQSMHCLIVEQCNKTRQPQATMQSGNSDLCGVLCIKTCKQSSTVLKMCI